MRLALHSLLRLEVSVNDAQAVQVVQAQSQLSQVKLHVLLREHNLQGGRGSQPLLQERGHWAVSSFLVPRVHFEEDP